jgi:hypothetical protein
MKISVITPVLNECPWIGFSILAALPYVHEFVYALDAKSDDGTRDLLYHIKKKYAFEKLRILNEPTFHPSDMAKYNQAFNHCVKESTGDAVWFLHPDMFVTDFPVSGMSPFAMAWYTHLTSYAGTDIVISKGRTDKWKNIHAKKMGLHYFGGYGSQNEDFYHSDITGKSYKHYGSEFSKYPFQVVDSGIRVNHYCEAKDYDRRFEKMVLCLKTQHPGRSESELRDIARIHPRVTLKDGMGFMFQEAKEPIPELFQKHQDEFNAFKKELVHG